MVGEAVHGRGKVNRTKVGRTIDGRTKDVVPSKQNNKLQIQTSSHFFAVFIGKFGQARLNEWYMSSRKYLPHTLDNAICGFYNSKFVH